MKSSPQQDLEDRLEALEPPYRSRGEAQVGRLLDRYGIPFYYEQPTLIYDRGRHRVWHPDFVLPDYNSMIVEYAGMPDIPEYMAGIRHKQKVYRANGIAALFIYPNDLTGPSWTVRLVERIEQVGRESTTYSILHRASGSAYEGHRIVGYAPADANDARTEDCPGLHRRYSN